MQNRILKITWDLDSENGILFYLKNIPNFDFFSGKYILKILISGLFIRPHTPDSELASFNRQTEEAKKLAKFGYAALEATKVFRQK